MDFKATELSDFLYHPKPSYVTIARSLIRDGDQSAWDLSDRTGIYIKTVQVILRDMKAKNVIHVCRWDYAKAHSWRPIYTEGSGRDAPRPRQENMLARDKALYAQREHDKAHFLQMIHALAGKPGARSPALLANP